MGCDFFIFTYLKIDHLHGTSYIELSCKRGYFCDCLDPGYDSDTNNSDEYYERINKIQKIYLLPTIDPILIYDDQGYLTKRFYEKYDTLINNKIYEKQPYWKDKGVIEKKEDIISIYKLEIRQELGL